MVVRQLNISTLDMKVKTGEDIRIEEREPSEITHLGGKRMAPDGIEVKNPAFDITPHRLVEAIITEKGIVKAPYDKNLKKLIS